jgi:multiple sugar transport system permease protein
MNKRSAAIWRALPRYAIIMGAAIISVFPMLIMIDTAIKPSSEIAGNQHWTPNSPTLSFVISTLSNPMLWRWLRNSAIIAGGVTAVCLALAIPASFVLARRVFKGHRLFLDGILVTQTMAPAVLIVPLFSLMRRLHLLNSYTGVIIVSAAFVLPFSVWLLMAFFRQISNEIEEAAALDNTTGLRFLIRFVIPMSKPGIAATAVWAFMYGWNEFMFSLTFLIGASWKWPITVGVFDAEGEFTVQWQPLMIIALVGTIPVLLLFIALRKRFETMLGRSFTRGT